MVKKEEEVVRIENKEGNTNHYSVSACIPSLTTSLNR